MLEAVVLAGGLGTRLRSVIEELPKCMAPVAGRPFISYVLDYFQQKGVSRFILALGYKHEAIQSYVSSHYAAGLFRYSIEQAPLGTGGAIRLACFEASSDSVLVLNGDTFFGVDPGALASFHIEHEAECTLALKPMKDFDRYGAVSLRDDKRIEKFQEKKYYQSGLINGGVYMVKRESMLDERLPEKFSFEKDYLETYYDSRRMFGMVQDRYFIDIGIPSDYEIAQSELVLNI
jgi:D-glycero-alpha-D-manno-heptose 1-phosphate guanylyltransferase